MTTARLFAPSDQNRLLLTLPTEDRERLLSQMEGRTFDLSEPLVIRGRPTSLIFFPTSGVGSVIISMENGDSVETGTIGNEGFIGIPVLLGGDIPPYDVVCQIPGEMFVLPVEAFRSAIQEMPAFHDVLERYTLAFLAQSTQSTACNQLHSIAQRCARWLLMTHDRVGRDEFRLTQEYLAMMLSVRRPSVSIAAAGLQEEGIIAYHRGGITVLNRQGLEAAACECYHVTRSEYERLVPAPGELTVR